MHTPGRSRRVRTRRALALLAACAILIVAAGYWFGPRTLNPQHHVVALAARAQLFGTITGLALLRGQAETRPTAWGWSVIFHNAWAACPNDIHGIGSCRFGNPVYRDIHACLLASTWHLYQWGASPRSIETDDEPCGEPPGRMAE
jgi:hypothetical protein